MHGFVDAGDVGSSVSKVKVEGVVVVVVVIIIAALHRNDDAAKDCTFNKRT